MSNPLSPIFDISGGNTGTTDIPLMFSVPGPNLQILWTYDGSDPTTGTVWSVGQYVPYNSWTYTNASSASATTYVQAIMYDTVQDTYSPIVVQDYTFTCSDPVITQTTTVNISNESPDSLLWYYSGTSDNFDTLVESATQITNPSSLSLSTGTYVFFSTTSDGVVYNPNIINTVVTSGSFVPSPVISTNSRIIFKQDSRAYLDSIIRSNSLVFDLTNNRLLYSPSGTNYFEFYPGQTSSGGSVSSASGVTSAQFETDPDPVISLFSARTTSAALQNILSASEFPFWSVGYRTKKYMFSGPTSGNYQATIVFQGARHNDSSWDTANQISATITSASPVISEFYTNKLTKWSAQLFVDSGTIPFPGVSASVEL